MIMIKFKNLDKSQLAKDIVEEKLEALVEKFDDLAKSKIMVTLEMENSPVKAGPDLFNIKLHISNGRYRGITVKKSDSSLYRALADLMDHMLEKLNRFGDRSRVIKRNQARRLGFASY